MKSYNHKCIKVCSLMKVSLLYISITCELIIILFHLQMVPTISLIALSAVLEDIVSVTISTTQHSNAYHIIIQWLNNYIHDYKNVFTTFITMHRRRKLGGRGRWGTRGTVTPLLKTFLRLVPPLEQGSIPRIYWHGQLMFTSIK